MKQFLKNLFLSISVLSILLLPTVSLAVTDYRQGIEQQGSAFVGPNGLGNSDTTTPLDIRLVVANLIRYALTAIGTVFFAYAVYAGYKIMMARGDDEKVNIGKDTLRRATIGIIVVLSAYAMTVLVSTVYDYTFPPERNYMNVDVDIVPYDQYGNPDPLR